MGDHHQEQDQLLPIANVGRIMKQKLPSNAKISKEAKQTMQECATEFISFVTGEASDKCHKENRKTVNGDDICWALSALGFDNYAEAILKYLHKYREYERETKANSQNKRVLTSKEEDQEPMDNEEEHQRSEQQQQQKQQAETSTLKLEFRVLEKGKNPVTDPS